MNLVEPCHKVAKNLAKLCLCSSILWKVELVSDEIGYLAEEISKQSIEGGPWFLLTAYSKMQEERHEEGIIKQKRNWQFKIWKILILSKLQKVRKRVQKRTLNVWLTDHLIGRVVWI